MLRLLAPLFGFAIFGALFAGLYYQPDEVERQIGPPKFRLAPLDAKPDFIGASVLGENISVNITVLQGGPIDVYLLDMENLTQSVLNGTRYGFELPENATFYDPRYTRQDIATDHNFTFVADGENLWAVVFVSRVPYPEGWENMTDEEREPYITEVFVNMRYRDSEQKSLIIGGILATPSIGLIGYTLWLKSRREGEEGTDEAPVYRYPHDRGL